MTCHMKNNITLSAKLLNFLARKENISSMDELIEKIEYAILNYYKISLIDIYNEKVNFNNYVYIYLDPSKIGKWKLRDNYYVHHEPFYIGKGQAERNVSHIRYNSNFKMNQRLNQIKNNGFEPEIIITDKNLFSLLAHNIENKYIAILREQNVDLCNLTKQLNNKQYSNELSTAPLNIERNHNILILLALNNSKNKHDAAELLGITERTLYRKLKHLNLIQNGKQYSFN